jgi:hypothetical protein
MDLRKTKDLADSSEGEHRGRLEKPAEQGQKKSRFQLALEVEDLFEEKRPKLNLKSAGIRTRYIE